MGDGENIICAFSICGFGEFSHLVDRLVPDTCSYIFNMVFCNRPPERFSPHTVLEISLFFNSFLQFLLDIPENLVYNLKDEEIQILSKGYFPICKRIINCCMTFTRRINLFQNDCSVLLNNTVKR